MMNRLLKSGTGFLVLLLISVCTIKTFAQSESQEQQLYQIKIYHLDNPDQEQRVDDFLKDAYVPALHRTGIEEVGVFKPLGQDTTSDRRIYVLIPFSSFDQYKSLPQTLQDDDAYLSEGDSYINAPRDQPPYSHIETILLEAFPLAPNIQVPDLRSPKSERVYELRSYGSPTEVFYRRKVDMFNEGGDEIEIFTRLGFNAVFYGSVLSGSKMPNLMYMTSFDNMESRDKLWDQFANDHRWEEISTMPKYEDLVSRLEIQFLRATEYSDI
jgi:hypothetical protein